MERLLVLQIVGLGTIIKVISVFCVQLIVSLVSMLIFVAVVSLGFIYMEGFVKVRALMGSTSVSYTHLVIDNLTRSLLLTFLYY